MSDGFEDDDPEFGDGLPVELDLSDEPDDVGVVPDEDEKLDEFGIPLDYGMKVVVDPEEADAIADFMF